MTDEKQDVKKAPENDSDKAGSPDSAEQGEDTTKTSHQSQQEDTSPDTSDKEAEVRATKYDDLSPEQMKEKLKAQAEALKGSKAEALRWKAAVAQQPEQSKPERAEAKQKSSEEDVTTTDDEQLAFTDEQVKLFKQLAEKAGLGSPDQVAEQVYTEKQYKAEQQTAINKFLDDFPEYADTENDTSNKMWAELQQQIVNMYKAPAAGKDWYLVLKKAHKDLVEDPTLEFEKGVSFAQAQANLLEQKKLGSTASGADSSQDGAEQMSPERRTVHEGFQKVRPQYFKEKK